MMDIPLSCDGGGVLDLQLYQRVYLLLCATLCVSWCVESCCCAPFNVTRRNEWILLPMSEFYENNAKQKKTMGRFPFCALPAVLRCVGKVSFPQVSSGLCRGNEAC